MTATVLIGFVPLTAARASCDSAGGEEAAGDPATMAVERHRIHFPKVQWRGLGASEKRRIDDWAVVNRKIGVTSGSYTKFSLDVVTSDGAKLHVKGKLRHMENAEEYDQGLLGFYIEELTGISNIGPAVPYQENLSASITAGDSSGETWAFSAQKHYVPGQIILPSGTITDGVRTLNIKSRTDGPGDLGRFVEIYEDGEWLFQWASERGDEYVFRVGLDPQLKLLLLASMEAFAVGSLASFWWTLP